MSLAPPTEYSHPEVLVSTEWLAGHLDDPTVRVVEVDYDPTANYHQGHIPGSALFDWKSDLNDPVTRDILSQNQLEELLSKNAISKDHTIILYGDFNNWFAAYAFWDLKYYGVDKVKLLNGGRKKWLLEDRPVTRDVPNRGPSKYQATAPNKGIRIFKDEVKEALQDKRKILVDVRGPKEFSGEILAPPEYPTEHAQRGGHIPGAKNIPWGQAVNDGDGTFKTRPELETLYRSKGVSPDNEVITYCRIGERSSHTWFVLTYLLGYPNVRNYDGSWTEWGNSIRFPIEK
jgi:thiosulfate/3-mercaptopyruvate sulfurtransferase